MLGAILPTMTRCGEAMPDVTAAARHLESLGFESAWVVDQLVAGTGVPFLHSTVALAASAAATSKIKLAYGVMIVPLRHVVWAAKEIASLQAVSGNRTLLGVGVGGDRHDLSWSAAGVPRSARGRRTDEALTALPGLIAGEAVDVPGSGTVRLSPGTPVPPIIVGGASDAALRRTVARADGWYSFPVPPEMVASSYARLGELAAERGRPVPALTASIMAVLDGDPDAPSRDGLTRLLTDVDGMYGIPPEAVDQVITGPPAALAERIAALRDVGAERMVASVAAGNWDRQTELVREAWALVD
jgi:alkanesulfonate monooxygenase SsuD/methylene tetrahydromethanopterin reductase-like flavin-dependent oxidoreductase (luciferase family)